MRRIAAALFFACLFVLSAKVHAHSQLMEIVPADGAVLAAPPRDIILTFSEPVTPLVLRLLGPGGRQVQLGPPEVHDTRLSVAVPPQAPLGSYLFSWRVASADGHPVGGTLNFVVGTPDRQARAAAPPYRAPMLYPAIIAVSFALLAGLLFGIGGVAFNAWAAQYEAGGCRKHLPALLLAVVAAPVSLGLQGLDALAAPWSAIITRACWSAAMSTSYGVLVWIAEAAALMGLFASVVASERWRRGLALLAVLLLGLSLASSGHAATATEGNGARIVVFLHVLAVAAWLGALACLPVLLLAGYGETPLRRFSKAALAIVAVLVATGLLLSWWQLREPGDLWRTYFGRVLLAKLALVVALLALGAANRWRWTAATLGGNMDALRSLVRNIRWEIALAAAILFVVALWRFTPPFVAPRAVTLAARHVTVPLRGTRYAGEARIVANADGHARVTIALTGKDGNPLPAEELSATFSMPQAGIEGIVRPARPVDGDAAGTWVVDDVPLVISGEWRISVQGEVPEQDGISLEGQGHIEATRPAAR
ncbi:Copper resistance protein CopC [Bordetella sputigena]|uniref:copper resistance CopC/CopD family protein n=1 Tax=Bordetella sputigena TaxID=1416810 RepID=UPI0039EED729